MDDIIAQVLAIIVIGLGILMVIPFHIVIREKNTVLKKLKWYKWLIKPDFYLVSIIIFFWSLSLIITVLIYSNLANLIRLQLDLIVSKA